MRDVQWEMSLQSNWLDANLESALGPLTAIGEHIILVHSHSYLVTATSLKIRYLLLPQFYWKVYNLAWLSQVIPDKRNMLWNACPNKRLTFLHSLDGLFHNDIHDLLFFFSQVSWIMATKLYIIQWKVRGSHEFSNKLFIYFLQLHILGVQWLHIWLVKIYSPILNTLLSRCHRSHFSATWSIPSSPPLTMLASTNLTIEWRGFLSQFLWPIDHWWILMCCQRAGLTGV